MESHADTSLPDVQGDLYSICRQKEVWPKQSSMRGLVAWFCPLWAPTFWQFVMKWSLLQWNRLQMQFPVCVLQSSCLMRCAVKKGSVVKYIWEILYIQPSFGESSMHIMIWSSLSILTWHFSKQFNIAPLFVRVIRQLLMCTSGIAYLLGAGAIERRTWLFSKRQPEKPRKARFIQFTAGKGTLSY